MKSDFSNTHKAKQQRINRNYSIRIDYYPSKLSNRLINSRRSAYAPCNSNSRILDTILKEWAELSGIKYRDLMGALSSASNPELITASARARMTSASDLKSEATSCQARTQSGTKCKSKRLPGKKRCKWHGGMSTGPKSAEGKARALANLKQNQCNVAPNAQS